MANNTVTISGMFGSGHTYFAGSPVVITISGLQWPTDTPFSVVRVKVKYVGRVVGEFRADTGGQTSITFDISSALRAIWADYPFDDELSAAAGGSSISRSKRSYSLRVYTEFLNTDGEFTETDSGEISGGQCAIGWFTERERKMANNADVSWHEHENQRFGDASTKPTSSPERVGKSSITSWVDVDNGGTTCVYYKANITPGQDSGSQHPPMVLRDSVDYVDFLFVNRRGAVETCSGCIKEAMNIDVETKLYSRVERPTFSPSRSLTAIASGGRRSWNMSSGYQTREWAEWWALEFLMARQWWMLYKGQYVPVIVEPAKKSSGIYDRSKQQMPHVDFTVTMALEG